MATSALMWQKSNLSSLELWTATTRRHLHPDLGILQQPITEQHIGFAPLLVLQQRYLVFADSLCLELRRSKDLCPFAFPFILQLL